MELSQRLLALLFLASVATGLALGVLSDALYVLRVLCGETEKPRTGLQCALLFCTDLTLALTAALSLILLLYYLSDGQFRILAPSGMAAGFFLYTHTLGRLTVLCASTVARFIRRLILAPIAWIWRKTVGRIALASRIKATERRTKHLVDAASRGFLPPPKL